MSPLSRLFIKTSFIYLGVGLAIGILLAVQSLWNLPTYITALYPAYIHLLTVGWLTLLIFGVAYWMFPKYSQERPHGNEMQSWAAYFLLNIGLVIRLGSEPIVSQTGGIYWGYLLVLSAILQWLGGIIFIINLWKRVKVK
jgi:cbb3-type cytochrome oxidase subunit 1